VTDIIGFADAKQILPGPDHMINSLRLLCWKGHSRGTTNKETEQEKWV